MRAQSRKMQFVTSFGLYQQQVWPDMAFPIIPEITGQGVITVFFRQFLVVNQTMENLCPFCRKQHLELFSGIAFELIGRNQGKLVHSCLP